MIINKTLIAILFMILGALILAIQNTLVKALSFFYPIWEIVFFRGLSGTIISFFLLLFFGFTKLTTTKPIVHLIRAFSSVFCIVFFFFGLKYLLFAENQALLHTAPIIATLLALPFLGEKIKLGNLLAIFFGFIGIIIIIKPSYSLFNFYALLPLASAFFMAMTYIATRYLMDTESSVTVIFYYSIALLFTSIFFLPNNFIIPETSHLILLFSLGVTGSIGHYFLSQAGKYAEVRIITPFEYTGFIFVALIGYLFFNEILSLRVILGALFIICSGSYIIYKTR